MKRRILQLTLFIFFYALMIISAKAQNISNNEQFLSSDTIYGILEKNLKSTDVDNVEHPRSLKNISEIDYCVASGLSSYKYGRKLNSIKLEGAVTGNNVFIDNIQSSGTDYIYHDKTMSALSTLAGDSISVIPNWDGTAMHAYMYIDYNNDGAFTADLDKDNIPTEYGELVSYTYYNSQNSNGDAQNIDDTGIYKTNIPKFKIPNGLSVGSYRMRFKIDWNNLDACGGANINRYGGCMVDITLNITGQPASRTVTVSSKNDNAGNVAIISPQGITENSVTTYGSVTVQASAKAEYVFKFWEADKEFLSSENPYTYTGLDDIELVAVFEEGSQPSQSYCTVAGNNAGTSARMLNSIRLSDSKSTTTINNIQTSVTAPVYINKTSVVISSSAGETITPVLDWTGTYMHAYIYVDYNNDGVFSTVLGSNNLPTDNGELASFSYYLDKNSKGEPAIKSGGVTKSNVPSFTLPLDLKDGLYRMRVKVDWNSLDPCGSPTQPIKNNNGCIVDITLKIGAPTPVVPTYPVTFKNNNLIKWVQDWNDEFNGSEIDGNIWTKIPKIIEGSVPDWRVYMSPFDDCYEVSNGYLTLRGLRNNGLDPNDSRAYLTGGIYSCQKKIFKLCKLEIRAKFKNATGAWPAIWMKPHDAKVWPTNGEIDIMEHLNYDNIIHQTVHSLWTNAGNSYPQKTKTTEVDKDAWNVYGVEMHPDTVKFFINGVNTLSYPRTGASNQFPFDQAYYLLLDMQLGGGWVGSINASTLPAEMYIDYVRSYQKQEHGGEIIIEDNKKSIKSGDAIEEGTELTIKVNPTEGYRLLHLKLNDNDITKDYIEQSGYSFIVSEATAISASYELIPCSVKYMKTGNGNISIKDENDVEIPNNSNLNYGSKVKINFVPDSGEKVTSFVVNGEDKTEEINNDSALITLSKNTEIEVVFSNLSGVEDAESDAFDVKTDPKGLIISGYKEVSVFCPNGQIIAAQDINGSKFIPLQKGIYIVKCQDKTVKVSIK